jgi:predicted PurR-regulated permease PerM
MNRIGSWIIAVPRFLYEFIVGDDWTVAVAVLAGLVVTAVLNANHIVAWWLMPIVAIVMTGISIRRLHPRG